LCCLLFAQFKTHQGIKHLTWLLKHSCMRPARLYTFHFNADYWLPVSGLTDSKKVQNPGASCFADSRCRNFFSGDGGFLRARQILDDERLIENAL
jgi:hypothetical protein